jgi:predicted component of type VI protein secretion system
MPAQLVSLTGGPSILLDKPILLVGRHPECDIQIESRKISRRHCCIAQVDDYLVVRDLGSTNGIRVNGVRVLEGRVKAGDDLTIGGNRYRVSWDMLSESVLRVDLARKRRADEELPIAEIVADDLVESTDEPLPLAEPVEPDSVPPPKPAVPGDGQSRKHDAQNSHSSGERNSHSGIVPENLRLAPATDFDLPTSRPS